MEPDYSKIITILISVAAIVLSIISIEKNNRNNKRTIRVNRLEEINEILYFYNTYYDHLFWLNTDLKKIQNDKQKNDIDKVHEKIDDFLKITGEKFSSNRARLNTIADSYLPNKSKTNLKLRILNLNEYFGRLFLMLINKRHYLNDEKIASSGNVKKLIRQINIDIISEMKLGYKGLSNEEFNIYKNTHFPVDLGLSEKPLKYNPYKEVEPEQVSS